jgi:hypothetical protein
MYTTSLSLQNCLERANSNAAERQRLHAISPSLIRHLMDRGDIPEMFSMRE